MTTRRRFLLTSAGAALLPLSARLHAADPEFQPGEPLAKAHAHNDYYHKRPLLDALSHGFCSVEADIFLRGDQLLVGHYAFELRDERSLEKLYLAPLRKIAKANGGWIYPKQQPVQLLIDFKTDAAATYAALAPLLAEYGDILSTTRGGKHTPGAVTAVISGNRPIAQLTEADLRHAAIDGRIGDLDSDQPADLIPLISESWRSHFKWNGSGDMPAAEREKLHDFVRRAHARGSRVRFWATPESEAVWRELIGAKVDHLNTDDLPRLAKFLAKAE